MNRRGRLARELFVESLVLALMGGVAGIGFAIAVVKLVLKISPARLPRFEQVSIDSTALLFTLASSVAAGLAVGAIPVLKHGGTRLAQALRAGGRNASAGRDRKIARNTLTVVQVALPLAKIGSCELAPVMGNALMRLTANTPGTPARTPADA